MEDQGEGHEAQIAGAARIYKRRIAVTIPGSMFVPDFTAPQPRSAAWRRFAKLLAPCDDAGLARLAAESARVTRQNFGRAIRLFAPLYLSNECINTCTYCGFSRDNAILRVTLDAAALAAEARHLAAEGFRHLLLVAGEHPKFVSAGYLEQCVRALVPFVPSISLEVAPLDTADYATLAGAGAEGLVVYQETYDRTAYAALHTAGPKRDYDYRLATAERAYHGGFRRLGLGALFGLVDWRHEALALAAHLDYLLRRCWRASFTVSLPRLRPCAGEFVPPHPLGDRDFLQLLCAFRICFPQVGLVLSTRESAGLRDMLIPLGITHMSAGSHTEPGGYTGAGKDDLHLTVRGRVVQTDLTDEDHATGQFEIADERSAAEIAALLHARGFEAVWKDWDVAILGGSETEGINSSWRNPPLAASVR